MPKSNESIVLGLDPGLRSSGWGLIKFSNGKFAHIDSGTWQLAADAPHRSLAQRLSETISRYRPNIIVAEEIFFQKNVRSAMSTAEILGVILERSAHFGIPAIKLSPVTVKKHVCGRGDAPKDEVWRMVRLILGLKRVSSNHAADALAIAIAGCLGKSTTGRVDSD